MVRLLMLLFILLPDSAALAQWLHTTNQDAFDETITQMAMVPSGIYALGFTCVAKDKAQLVLLTPEEYDKSMSLAELLGAKLLVRIDNLTIHKLDVGFDDVSGKLRAVATGDGVIDAAKEMAAAKQRIAIAIEVADKKFHTNNFGVGNSRNSIGKALRGCAID